MAKEETRGMMDASEDDYIEIKAQMATQDYDCDECGEVVSDETLYIRVAVLAGRKKKGGLSARYYNGIEKYHPSCWDSIQ